MGKKNSLENKEDIRINSRFDAIEKHLKEIGAKFSSLDRLSDTIEGLKKTVDEITASQSQHNSKLQDDEKTDLAADVERLKSEKEALNSELDREKEDRAEEVKLLKSEKEDLDSKLEQEKEDRAEEVKRLKSEKEDLGSKLNQEKEDRAKEVELLKSEKEDFDSKLKQEKEDRAKEVELLKSEKEDLGSKLKQEKEDRAADVKRLEGEKEALDSELKQEQAARAADVESLKRQKDEDMRNLLRRLMRALTGKDDEATIEELENKIDMLKKNLKSEQGHSEQLQQIVDSQTGEIASLNQQKLERDSVISALKDSVSNKGNQITDLNAIISTKSSEISSLQNDIEIKDAENCRLTSIISAHENCKAEFTNAILPFLDIFRLMQKCPSMQSVVEEQFGLPMEGELTISQQIQFANCFSDKTYCAGLVYEGLKQYKKVNIEPLSDDESELVKSLNEYYKNLFGIEEDILDCLSIEAGSVFNAKEMSLITNPNNSYLSKVNFLCVPALRNQDYLSELAQKALIMGG